MYMYMKCWIQKMKDKNTHSPSLYIARDVSFIAISLFSVLSISLHVDVVHYFNNHASTHTVGVSYLVQDWKVTFNFASRLNSATIG